MTRYIDSGQVQSISVSIPTKSSNQWVIHALDSLVPATPFSNAFIHYTVILYTLFTLVKSRLCLGLYPGSRYGVYSMGCICNGNDFTIYSVCQDAGVVVRELLKAASSLPASYSLYSSLCQRLSLSPSRDNFIAGITDIIPRYENASILVTYGRSQSQLQSIIESMLKSWTHSVATSDIPGVIIEPPVVDTNSPYTKLHTPGGLSGLVLVLYTEHMFDEGVVYHGGFMWLRKKQLKRILTYTDEKSVVDSLNKVFRGGELAGHQALVYIGVTRGVLGVDDVKGARITPVSEYVAMVLAHVDKYRGSHRKSSSATAHTPNVVLSAVLSKQKTTD